jgi:hypothetical protein
MQLLLSLLETEPEEDASTIWKGQRAPTGPDESKELGDE